MPRKMILDCDTGTDDAVAIMLAALHPDIELVACTTVNGNVAVENCTDNTLRTLDFIGCSHVPVYEGAVRPIVRVDSPLPRELQNKGKIHPTELPLPAAKSTKRDTGAVEFLIETYRRATEDIVLVPVGPLTNIAAALVADPSFVTRVPEVVIMGGAHDHGNITPSAEFNIWADPEAAAIVFAAGFRKITLVPLDATHKAVVTSAQCARLDELQTPAGIAAARFISQRIKGYDASQPMASPGSAPVHDAVCVNFLIDPAVVSTLHVHVAVETRGDLTLGRTVMDFKHRNRLPPNCHVAMDADAALFNATLYKTFSTARGRAGLERDDATKGG
jgi:inosine-uridine nucleoside N-ribohydrolase